MNRVTFLTFLHMYSIFQHSLPKMAALGITIRGTAYGIYFLRLRHDIGETSWSDRNMCRIRMMSYNFSVRLRKLVIL